MSSIHARLYTLFDRDPTQVVACIMRHTAHLPDDRDVLDVGCGPGRMLRMYPATWRIVGMEPDDDFRAAADQLADERITVRAGGFADIDETNAYDLIIAAGSFMYLLRPAERFDALRRMYRALKPGGTLFLDVANLIWVYRHYQPPADMHATLGEVEIRRISHHTFDDHAATFTHTEEFVLTHPEKGTRRISKQHQLAVITVPELLYGLEQAGFPAVQMFNSYGSDDPEPIAGSRILVTAHKQAVVTLGLIADIHGDLESLQAAFEILEREGVDEIVCMGDLVEKGADGDAVTRLIAERGIACVQGNHDKVAYDNQMWLRENGDPPAHIRLTDETLDILKILPEQLTHDYMGIRVVMAHGKPGKMYHYLRPPDSARDFRDVAASVDADVILLGHTHIPMRADVGAVSIFNPGSVYAYGSETCATLSLPDRTFTVFSLVTGEPTGFYEVDVS